LACGQRQQQQHDRVSTNISDDDADSDVDTIIHTIAISVEKITAPAIQ